jgi:hypothetical protein
VLAGVFIGRAVWTHPGVPMAFSRSGSFVQLIDADDLDITDLRITGIDPETGRVELVFDAFVGARVSGELGDEAVQQLLAAALDNGMRPGARLATVELMRDRVDSDTIRVALIDALLNDQNPAVRLEAIESLGSVTSLAEVRDALRAALSNDLNPGVRVQALDMLSDRREDETLATLRVAMHADANDYIRSRAQRLVEDWSQSGTGPGVTQAPGS